MVGILTGAFKVAWWGKVLLWVGVGWSGCVAVDKGRWIRTDRRCDDFLGWVRLMEEAVEGKERKGNVSG